MSPPTVLAGLCLAAAMYSAGWLRLSRRAGRPLAPRRLAAAMTSLVAVGVALCSPLDGLAHERFAAHMVQHLLLTTLAAPLALLADPFPIVLWALSGRARRALRPLFVRHGPLRRLLGVLTWMPIAWLLHALTLWLWHLPGPYERALANGFVHALEHASFVVTALLFWWPLLGPAPRARPPARRGASVVYMVLAGFQSGTLGLGLMLWPTLLYPSYARQGASGLDDQAWGGIVMWSVGGVVDMAVVMALLWRFLAVDEGTRPRPFLDRPDLVRDN
jgi:cytochrome c oxidase assembly factor CtaG